MILPRFVEALQGKVVGSEILVTTYPIRVLGARLASSYPSLSHTAPGCVDHSQIVVRRQILAG